MLTVPHALTGAAIGALVKDATVAPLVAFSVGWVSHYVLDTIPHWERLYRPHDEIKFDTDQSARDWPKHIFVQAVLDVLIATGLIMWIYQSRAEVGSVMLWGALGAVLPDLLDNVPFWNRTLRRLPFFSQEQKFHDSIHINEDTQRRVPKILGLLTQVAVVVISLFIIFAA
jgi:hypothetical protein